MESKFRQTDEEEKLGQLLRSLDRVEAPVGFGTRVKARIAAEKPDGSRRGLSWLVRLGAPAAGLLMLGAMIWLAGGTAPGDLSDAVVGPEPFVRPVVVESNRPADTPEVAETRMPEDGRLGSKRAEPSEVPKKETRAVTEERGSVDFAIRQGKTRAPKETIGPVPGKDMMARPSIPIEGVLVDLGIGANVENGKWIVKTVRANSLADRSRIIAGDVIEAIDDRAVGAATVFERSAQGKTITVTRNGVKVVVPLK